MSNIRNHLLSIALWVCCYCLVACYCYRFFAYNYPYMEQMDMFVFNSNYASERILQVGGLISYLTAFLTQFFIQPVWGALISSLLFCIVSWQNCDIWQKISSRKTVPLLYFLPGIALLWMQTDFMYHWEGTLGTIFSIFLFNVYIRLSSFASRWIYMAVSVPIGYLVAGPVVFMAATGSVVYEIIASKDKYRWASLLLIPWSCIVPYVLCSMDVIPQTRLAFTFDMYYHPRLSSKALYYCASAAFLLNVFGASFVAKWHKEFSSRIKYAFFALQIVVAGMILHWGTIKVNNEKIYVAKQLDYYTRTGQWKELLEFDGLRSGQNFMHACYQNLALSELGMMGDFLFKYTQPGINGLIIPWDQSVNSSMLLSDVYYRMGNIALSQEMAFEGLVGTERGMNPRLLLRLVQTNIIFGHYKVALKYIRILEDTFSYREAATYYRNLIENPALMAEAKEIVEKRECTKGADLLTNTTQIENVFQIVKAYPTYDPALHYYGALCLVSKNMVAFSDLVKVYFETGKSMPRYFQEAFLIMHEKDGDKWEEYGLGEDVINRFKAFRRDVISVRRRGGNPAYALKGKYADSYWYYFMFNR